MGIPSKIKALLMKLATKRLKEKLQLEDKTVTEIKTEGKPWYKSKTLWAAIFLVLKVGIEEVSKAMGHPIILPDWILQVAAGLGLWGLRTATKPVV